MSGANSLRVWSPKSLGFVYSIYSRPHSGRIETVAPDPLTPNWSVSTRNPQDAKQQGQESVGGRWAPPLQERKESASRGFLRRKTRRQRDLKLTTHPPRPGPMQSDLQAR